MKSIKEKAKEYGKANLTAWGVISTERVEGFESGANYVLDVLEEFMKHNLVHSSNIRRLIKQLKK